MQKSSNSDSQTLWLKQYDSPAKSICKKRVSGGDSDILFAADGKADGAARDRSPEVGFPQQIAAARVECKEITIAAAAEEDVRSRRQNAGIGNVAHLELPLTSRPIGLPRRRKERVNELGPEGRENLAPAVRAG